MKPSTRYLQTLLRQSSLTSTSGRAAAASRFSKVQLQQRYISHISRPSTSVFRSAIKTTTFSLFPQTHQLRHDSSTSSPDDTNTRAARPLTDSPSSSSPAKTEPPKDVPAYELTFTCKPCMTRSSHRVSKQGYHKGTVLITCPSCKNRHIISDHLKIFRDQRTTIEDIMKEKGQLVKKGTLGVDEDVEFWEDGTITERPVQAKDEQGKEGENGEEKK